MLNINYQERIFDYTNWATILFILSFIIIAINKNVFEVKFVEFMRLGISNKYTKIYKDSSNMRSSFTISMFVLQVLSYTFLILLFLSQENPSYKSNFTVFIQIFVYLAVFILVKYLIEKIIATTFKIEDFAEQFNFLKVSYRTYFAVLLLPVNLILYYNNYEKDWPFLIIFAILLVFNLTTYLLSLKIYQNIVIGKLFYFILYLCTFEIAPYYFIYKWITKN
uniref:DUF4271 domain-containing protein n=1 Tax=Flavobacterium sp. TaxID=239 RepID=UPI004049447F